MFADSPTAIGIVLPNDDSSLLEDLCHFLQDPKKVSRRGAGLAGEGHGVLSGVAKVDGARCALWGVHALRATPKAAAQPIAGALQTTMSEIGLGSAGSVGVT